MEKKSNIYQRINYVMAELKNVTKESKKVNGQFRYISFNKVYEDVKPLFIKYGIVNTIDAVGYQQDGNMGTLTAEVAFVNIDNPEDKIVGKWVGQGISGNRNGSADDKSIGKALSYLHKNAICKLLLLGGSEKEEVDSDANVNHTKATTTKAAGKAKDTPFAEQQSNAPTPQGAADNPFVN